MSSRSKAFRFGTRSSNAGRARFLLAACITFTLAFGGTASASLLGDVTGTVTNLTAPTSSPITIPTGLAQLSAGVSGLLTGAQASLVPGQAAVSAFQTSIDASIAPAITNLQTQIQHTAADAQALDTTAATADLQAAVASLQAAATGEVGALSGVALTQALTNGLSVAQQVVSPICSILGVPAALASGVGVDLTRFYPLSTAIPPVDAAANSLLTGTYTTLYNAILTTAINSLGPTGAAAGAIINTLLKYNWTTTYYPPGGGAPIVKSTPALLDVPTPVDVDNSGSYDLCATTTLALNGSAFQVQQQITKLPLSPAVMPVDISAGLISGLLGFGYQTKDSTAPINYTTNVNSGSAGFTTDNTYTLFRGKTLTLPPLLNNFVSTPLPLGLGNATLPNIPALLVDAPTPKLTQTVSLAGVLNYNMRYENQPNTTHFGYSTTAGTDMTYSGPAAGDLFSFNLAAAGLSLGNVKSVPAPTSLDFCYKTTTGVCTTGDTPADQAATDKGSLRMLSSQDVRIDEYGILGHPTDTTCGTLPISDAHFTGSRLYMSHTPGTATAGSGKFWINSAGTPVTGCVASGGLPVTTMPAGFTADKRQGLYHTQSFGLVAAPDAKSGSITCPTGTTAVYNLLLHIEPVICAFPPTIVATAPTGQAFVGSTLTAHATTTPTTAGNVPTLTYQWQRCKPAPVGCTDISGATASTYTSPIGSPPSSSVDLGYTLRVVITATNFDGHATATSPETAAVTLPPQPSNLTPPVITGIAGTGRTLTTSNGTWANGVASYAYQWQLCAADGTACSDITGQTANTYVPSLTDQGHQVKAKVFATNIGGTAVATSAGVFIPPPPVNTAPPIIKIGSTPVAGNNVFEADHLSTTDGSWTNSPTFTYQWERCDALGMSCAPIASATANTYTASHDDIGSTLTVLVTGTNSDGFAVAAAAPTGQVLANALLPQAPGAVPDGPVNAIAPSDHNTAYIGGQFDTAGPVVDGAGAVAATPTAPSKAVTLAANVRGGQVNAVASDTTGGYFLGGNFSSVKGAACKAVAHIKSDGTLDPTYCRPASFSGDVRALDYVKRNVTIGSAVPVDVLAVGGNYTVGGHANFMFLDNTGLASFAPSGDPDAAVNAIADDTVASRPNFFVGGDFLNAGGVAARRLVLVSITAPPTAGTALTLAASAYPGGVDCAGGTCTNASVRTIAFVNASSLPNVVVGGVFDSAYPTTSTGTITAPRTIRNNAVSFAEVGNGNQAVGAWDPSPNGPVNAISGPTSGTAAIYLAGDFTSLGANGVPVSGFKGLAEYGLASSLTSLSPLLWSSKNNTAGTAVNSSPNTLWKPQVDNGTVKTILSDTAAANGIYVGGTFTSINSTIRHRLAQLPLPGASAPVLGAFDPNAGQAVRSLARFTPASPAVPSIFVGGDYTVLGGETRNNVAELSPAGVLASWTPAGTNGPVNALAVKGGVLYAGGTFTQAGGIARSNLAAFDTASAATTAWAPVTTGAGATVNALGAGASSIYVGGKFTSAGGSAAANLAALDPASGAASAWGGADDAVNAILPSGADVYVGGAFSNAGGAARPRIADIDATTGLAKPWNPGADNSVNALAADSSTVYVGGTFAHAGGSPRNRIASLDRSTGAATTWDPNADAAVNALRVLGSKVFVGGLFANIGNPSAPRSHMAQLDSTTGETTGFLPEPDGAVNAIAFTSGGSLAIGGAFGLASGVLTSGIAFFGS